MFGYGESDILGETIDIHCGGVDLKFPHHENEIAQSACAHDGAPLANYWVHNEFLNMGKDKMSKSLGNVQLVHDLLKDWDGEVIRLALLKAHYRSELVWTEDLLKESKAQLDTRYHYKKMHLESKNFDPDYKKIPDRFFNELLDDIATPEAVSVLSQFYHGQVIIRNKTVRNGSPWQAAANLLGLLQKDPQDWFKGDVSEADEVRFDALAEARAQARRAKDWERADQIRDEGRALGIVFEDSPDGTTWRRE